MGQAAAEAVKRTTGNWGNVTSTLGPEWVSAGRLSHHLLVRPARNAVMARALTEA